MTLTKKETMKILEHHNDASIEDLRVDVKITTDEQGNYAFTEIMVFCETCNHILARTTIQP